MGLRTELQHGGKAVLTSVPSAQCVCVFSPYCCWPQGTLLCMSASVLPDITQTPIFFFFFFGVHNRHAPEH